MPELITGTKGTPHVTSTQDRSIYEKIIGKGSYILDDNELLEPELQSNQSLRIRSGMLYHHGSITEVKRNTYDEVTIANGSQGMKRIDLVVLRYTKNPETEIEETNWVVIQGTPAASDPIAPAYTEGNMQEGDLTDDCPVFEVHLDGIQVTEVVKLLKVLEGSLESLNSKIPDVYYEEVALHYYNGSYMTGTVNVGKQFAGRPVQVTLIYKDGYPTAQTWNVSATPVDANGNTTIWAVGSNYISAHVMSVLVRCETE